MIIQVQHPACLNANLCVTPPWEYFNNRNIIKIYILFEILLNISIFGNS